MKDVGDSWHIGDKGSVNKCDANLAPCPLKHFSSKDEASQYAKLNKMLQSVSGTVLRHKMSKDSDSLFSGVDFVKKLPPQIYAFSIPGLAEGLNATKVGDTTRGVEVRLREWRQKGGIYQNLKLKFNLDASFEDKDGNTIYVRDYNFHVWLKKEGYQALVDVLDEYPHLKDTSEGISQEFFFKKTNREEEITEQMLRKSLKHQQDQYGRPASPYAYYREVRGQQVTAHYAPVNEYEMRPFQKEIVSKAVTYFESTKDEDAQFLLSAPTRSGKSFMAANTVSQLFDNSPKKNNCVVIVSGFAEIEDEWKSTFESHKKFAREDGKTAADNKCGESPCVCKNRFKYLSVSDLRRNQSAVQDAFDAGYDNAAVFLTLQDLSGSTADEKGVKEVHSFLEKKDSVDFLIGDEAHFAMFSNGRYQDSIKTVPGVNDDALIDTVSEEEAEAIGGMLGTMTPTQGKLFVTATPYNNVPWGTKFNQSLNAAVIRETDIREEKAKWDAENVVKVNPAAEWANPSYGLPEKKMFGVDVGMSPNELFAVSSSGAFQNRKAVQQFITEFFGITDNTSIPNFFGNKEFRDAGLGNHIYATLPSRKACDAFEREMKSVLRDRGLTDYEVLNISSANSRHPTARKRASEIKDDITRLAESGKKTITVTCNRMGTGVTQEYWDTVLLLRTMSSAQQFQQTAGRPGTPHVSSRNNLSEKVRLNKKLCRSCERSEIRAVGKFLCSACFKKGGENLEELKQDRTLKHVEKPNVAVISLDPGQLVKIRQEAILADIAEDEASDSDEVDRITDEELSATPLFILNNESLELEKVTASNIMEHFLAHIKQQGVMEMVGDIAVNTHNMSEELESAIFKTYEPNHKESTEFSTPIVEEDWIAKRESVRLCIRPDCDEPVKAGQTGSGNPFRLCEMHHEEAKAKRESEEEGTETNEASRDAEDEAEKEYQSEVAARVKSAYIAALLYSVLSSTPLTGVDSIIRSNNKYKGSQRLARHIGLDLNILSQLKQEGVAGIDLDNRIKLLSELSHNESFSSQWERMTIALNSFRRFSANEIPTPDKLADKLVEALGITKNDFSKVAASSSGIIDTGSKSAVNLVKLASKASENGIDISDKMWSVPTSGATYELTRRVYKDHNWDLNKIVFHDNLDNLETVQLVQLLQESQKCQASNPAECRFHKNKAGIVKMKAELAKLEQKMDDPKEFSRIKRTLRGVGRFDFCVSNPPYQKAPQKNTQNRREAVYTEFVDLGSQISDVSVMVHPVKAFRGVPEIPSDSTRRILASEEYSVSYVEPNAQKFFPTVDIRGGIMISKFERGSKNSVRWEEVGLPVEAMSILNAVREDNKLGSMSEMMKRSFHYNKETRKKIDKLSQVVDSNHFTLYPELYLEKKPSRGKYLAAYGLTNKQRLIRYIKADTIDSTGAEMYSGYKVLVNAAMKSGRFGEKISDTIVTDNNSISTRTYINIGPFATKDEADAAQKYMKTRFARMLLSTKKLTHNAPIHMYTNIPNQDFSEKSSIDWSGTVDSIDKQFYKKYKLSKEQIEWMEKTIDKMD